MSIVRNRALSVSQPINRSEEFVYQVCRRSFLSLWSYANPRGKDKSKELCDILVVCDPDIVIFSVKEIGLTDSGDISTDWKRWRKRAIESSVKQIYGAERWIENASHVVRNDGSEGLAFPDAPQRRIHRVAVALGGDGKVPIQYGYFGKGFVHVFDGISFQIIMSELDTITDFIKYLGAKEELYESGIQTIFHGGEEDLLAFYLHHGREFPKNYDLCIIDDNLWLGFISRPEYRAKKDADDDSYVWDQLLGILSDDILRGDIEFGPNLSESEIAIRVMAREDRFSRRILGKSFIEFYELAGQKKVRSRMVLGMSDVTYVFLAMPHGEDRKFRVAELGGRCYVARGLHQDRNTVIGLATEQYEQGKGFSFDITFLYKPTWTDEDQRQMEFCQKEFGYFASPLEQPIHEDEYPTG